MDTKGRKWRLATTPLAMAGLMALAVAAPGCDEDNPLCCNEGDFQVGGTVSLEGEAGVGLQAVADFSGIASAMIEDLTATCRTMAEELDVPKEERDAAEQNPDKRAKMEAYCDMAVSAIASFEVSISVVFEPPVCEASISAKADCQAKCSGSAECDIQANPPTCEGGKLEVSCSGSCTAEAGATLTCTGGCNGGCTGSCTAEGGVECAGRCEGTCMGGTDDQGNCNGTCEGTCEATAPGVDCQGTCEGECEGSCEATAEASVKCDGQCDADYEPLKCTGGELKGGCTVEAKCEANCDASVSAKAECRPPQLSVEVTGGASADVRGKLKVVLEANLGIIAAIKARVEGMFDISGTVVANLPDVIGEIKVACIPVVIAAMGDAAADVEASVSATVAITGSVGM